MTVPQKFITPAEILEMIAWQSKAACIPYGPDTFFPKRGGDVASARKICAKCPVKSECLEFALANGEKDGVWGGCTGKDRRRIKRERRLAKAQQEALAVTAA